MTEETKAALETKATDAPEVQPEGKTEAEEVAEMTARHRDLFLSADEIAYLRRNILV